MLYNSQESIKQIQTGLVLDWDTKIGEVNSNVYSSNRDFVGLLPFNNGGYVELNRDFSGAEISIKDKSQNFEWMVGTSIQDQKDDRKRFENNEGEKSRTQFFKGVVIQIKGTGKTKTFTIRKMSGTVGIERIFPFNLPTIKKIEVNKKGKVRRSRIYYFKELRGKKARIKEVKK